MKSPSVALLLALASLASASLVHAQLYPGDIGKGSAPSQENSNAGEVVATNCPNFIFVGLVKTLHSFDAQGLDELYASYIVVARETHPNAEPALSRKALADTMTGWTYLLYQDRSQLTKAWVTTAGFIRVPLALVPTSLETQLKYGNMWFDPWGDLVAARSNADGFPVVSEILCKDDPTYSDCARQYARGLFDADSGVELNKKCQPKIPGDKIDVSSYKIVQ